MILYQPGRSVHHAHASLLFILSNWKSSDVVHSVSLAPAWNTLSLDKFEKDKDEGNKLLQDKNYVNTASAGEGFPR